MSEKYEPTPHLRFLKRQVPTDIEGVVRFERILQQWWVSSWDLSCQNVELKDYGYSDALDMKGEWRDVPCVESFFE